MSNYITNGTFDSNLNGWTNSGGDTNWEYDATGASHDGGSAKGTHDGSANTKERFRMYQSFSVSNSANINTAQMSAWIQLADSKSAADAGISASTAQFWVQLYTPAGAYKGVATQTYNFGTLQNDDIADAEDVKSIIQNGGDGTWRVYLICDIDRENTSCSWLVSWFDDVSLDITFSYSDTVTGTVEATTPAAVTQACTYSSTATGTVEVSTVNTHSTGYGTTATGTINVSSSTSGAKTLKTDYAYYLGTDNGTIHLTSDDYKGDAGVVIPCRYVTKDTDFSDQDQQSNDRWKTVYGVKLFYEDVYASTEITVSISTDSGTTWPHSQTQTLGTGDEARKDVMYWFIASGQFFRFKVSSGSASTTFKLLGMEVEYQDSGEYWTIA